MGEKELLKKDDEEDEFDYNIGDLDLDD